MFFQYIANGLVTGGGYVLAALGLTLVFGILDVINFAHGIFYTIGAFVTFTLAKEMGLNFFASLILSMVVLAVFGVVVERLIFRPLRSKGHLPQIIAANGLALVSIDAVRLIWTADPQHLPAPFTEKLLHIGNVVLNYQRILVVVAAIILVALLYWFIEKTWLGLQMRALAQDTMAGRLNGMNINKVSAVTFAISAAITAAAGILITPIFVLTPYVGDVITTKAFAIVILAGVGSITGTVIAGLFLGIIEALTAGYLAAGYESLIAFLLLIITLLFKPSGIMGKKT